MNKSRPNQIILRLSDQELKKINAEAKKAGMSRQKYFIKCLNESAVVVEQYEGIDPKMVYEVLFPSVAGIANNINQITRKLNSMNFIDYKNDLPLIREEVEELCRLLKRLTTQEQSKE